MSQCARGARGELLKAMRVAGVFCPFQELSRVQNWQSTEKLRLRCLGGRDGRERMSR